MGGENVARSIYLILLTCIHTYIHTYMLVNNARNPDLGNITYSYFTYLLLLTYFTYLYLGI